MTKPYTKEVDHVEVKSSHMMKEMIEIVIPNAEIDAVSNRAVVRDRFVNVDGWEYEIKNVIRTKGGAYDIDYTDPLTKKTSHKTWYTHRAEAMISHIARYHVRNLKLSKMGLHTYFNKAWLAQYRTSGIKGANYELYDDTNMIALVFDGISYRLPYGHIAGSLTLAYHFYYTFEDVVTNTTVCITSLVSKKRAVEYVIPFIEEIHKRNLALIATGKIDKNTLDLV